MWFTKNFMRDVSPRGAFGDLLEVWRQPTPHRWQILGVSVAATYAVMVLFIPESERAEPRHPDVTYISTFAPNRTEAEIVASNIANQKISDEVARREAERAALRRKMAMDLGRATGMDVDQMAADADRERAAEAAAKAAPPPQQAPAASDR
jgi:hypothetical protein